MQDQDTALPELQFFNEDREEQCKTSAVVGGTEWFSARLYPLTCTG